MAIGIKIDIDDRDLLKNLPTGNPTAEVFSSLRTRTGIPIFRLVDKGRGPIEPIRAKALRIPLNARQVIFRKKAGPAKAQNIKDRAVREVIPFLSLLLRTRNVSLNTRSGIAAYVNAVAEFAANSIRGKIKGRTGRLETSIQVKRAL